jgi:hypothetical protein
MLVVAIFLLLSLHGLRRTARLSPFPYGLRGLGLVYGSRLGRRPEYQAGPIHKIQVQRLIDIRVGFREKEEERRLHAAVG